MEKYAMMFVGKLNRKTVLVVDPDPHFRAQLRQTLEGAGFMVGEAANGKEGERVAFRVLPDAILIDLMMETIDAGKVLAGRLRDGGKNIPVFLISQVAEAIREDINTKRMGIAEVFGKPVDAESLVGAIRRHLRLD